MADNYLQFSEKIDHLTREEEEWMQTEITLLSNYDEGITPNTFEDGLGFDWNINRKEHELWIYAEENGNIDTIAYFVQEYINTFRLSYVFSLTWAETCSKPRVGEFSGGWMVVTADKICVGNCNDAIINCIKGLSDEPIES